MRDRVVVTLLFPIVWPVTAAMMLLIGMLSMRQLGRVLIRTGQNLQEYDW